MVSGFKEKKWLLDHLAEGNIYSRHKKPLGESYDKSDMYLVESYFLFENWEQ